MIRQQTDIASSERSPQVAVAPAADAVLAELIARQAHAQAQAALDSALAAAKVEDVQRVLLELVAAMRVFCTTARCWEGYDPGTWVGRNWQASMQLTLFECSLRQMDSAVYQDSPARFWELVQTCVHQILDVGRDSPDPDAAHRWYSRAVQYRLRTLRAMQASDRA